MKNNENQIVRVQIRIPKKTKEQLDWLKAQGYGSISTLVRETGIVKDILDMYINATQAERIKSKAD